MVREGRELELLVEGLEKQLRDSPDVTVESPKRIRGRQSGEMREIDVWVQVESAVDPLSVMIECRDRTGPQGIEWLDQVAGKRDDIGADRAILVSGSGFVKAAARYAAAKDVQLRTVSEVVADDLDWFDSSASLSFEWRLAEVVAVVASGQPVVLLDEHRRVDPEAACLVEPRSGEVAPYRDLVDHERLFRLGRSRPMSALDVFRVRMLTSTVGASLDVVTPEGHQPLAELHLTLAAEPVPPAASAMSYSGDGEALIDRVEMPLPWPVPRSIVVSRAGDGRTFSFGFSRRAEERRRSGFKWVV